jgi:hypothetical protein
MTDLAVGYAALAAGSAALFVLSARASRRLPPRAVDGATLLAVAGLLLYIRYVWYHPLLAEWLPFSNLIVVGNWLPLFSAMIAGLVWRRTADHPHRRRLTMLGLVGCGALAAIFPLLGTTPKCGHRWDGLETCLQTTNYTCSAACAATLLKRHGIDATEQEMAELCLTRRGTSWQGLYRGLKLKTASTPWDVQVFQCSADEVPRWQGSPLILSVGLAAGEPANSEFTREFGWKPGVNHSVVLEKFQFGGQAIISDPTQEMSREHWDRDTLHLLHRGTVVRLVKRPE